ncbi:ADP-ribosylglycohydrolase family protein [Paenibacillus planticolens]|uniref:ADP-ribosylglycohydrolase family protein n=1 Tax=Paenibacillus planticolens TaxID=2654976 RepID=UPI0028AF4898|nr:ADP-ribosylglycohydrolase family protein [Paenibacillus planticolens]
MEDERLHDRIKGGLYGVAVGDALGGTTEFMTTREINSVTAIWRISLVVEFGSWSREK